jgi:glycosyltransferase involved in cell wall biosynthesis
MGFIAIVFWFWLRIYGRPYGYELAGHASESLRRVKNVQILGLYRLLGWMTDVFTTKIARGAHCGAYVGQYVRGLYPTRNPEREWVFSSVRVNQNTMTGPRPRRTFEGKVRRIISVGRLEPEKGHAVFIKALARLRERRNFDFEAVILGGGQELESLRVMCLTLGLQDCVRLPGMVALGPDMFAYLDQAHLFILPSLTEGMPRALIEAMARGLPAIGSHVGGIAELLDDALLVRPEDPEVLANVIEGFVCDIDRLTEVSERNFKKAMNWHLDEMRRQKLAFWNCICETRGTTGMRS